MLRINSDFGDLNRAFLNEKKDKHYDPLSGKYIPKTMEEKIKEIKKDYHI